VGVEFRGPVTRALAGVPIDEIGHAFTSQQLRRGGDFEMQMRFSSISGFELIRSSILDSRLVLLEYRARKQTLQL
jgi:hypothetical protein